MYPVLWKLWAQWSFLVTLLLVAITHSDFHVPSISCVSKGPRYIIFSGDHKTVVDYIITDNFLCFTNVMFWDRSKVDSGGLFKRDESSTEESVQSVDWATTHACMNNLYKNKLHNKACTIITCSTTNEECFTHAHHDLIFSGHLSIFIIIKPTELVEIQTSPEPKIN